jgi:hypothetical protein
MPTVKTRAQLPYCQEHYRTRYKPDLVPGNQAGLTWSVHEVPGISLFFREVGTDYPISMNKTKPIPYIYDMFTNLVAIAYTLLEFIPYTCFETSPSNKS